MGQLKRDGPSKSLNPQSFAYPRNGGFLVFRDTQTLNPKKGGRNPKPPRMAPPMRPESMEQNSKKTLNGDLLNPKPQSYK